MLGLQPFCRNGHPKNKHNTYQGRCRLCRRLIARKRRAAGIVEGRPERKKEHYRKHREEVKSQSRARYHANKKKYCALRRIRRLQGRLDLDDNETLYLRELIAQVARIETISSSSLPPHPKIRYTRRDVEKKEDYMRPLWDG